MNSVLPYLINWLQQFGYPALWLAVFVASVGVPLPIVLVLLAAGAFAALGDFNIVILAITAISAAVCGDTVGYWIGRWWGSRVLDWLERSRRFQLISPEVIARSRAYFGRRGGWAIFLSRFLFSALGGVINVLAGADPYPFLRFLLFDAGGETLGAVILLGLGFLFGASLDVVGDLLSGISALLIGLLVVIILAFYLLKLLPLVAKKRAKQAITPTSTEVDQVATEGGSSTLLP
jgi:membrane-associated protein